MDWDSFIQKYFREFAFIAPCATTNIFSVMGVALPNDYLEFMHKYYGGEGAIWEKSYLRLFPLAELQEVNVDYCVEEFLPNHCIFASSGGGELYGVDASGHYFGVAAIMDETDKIIMGNTFVEFIGNLDSYLE